MEHVTLALVGDKGVGKTSMALSFGENKLIVEQYPTILQKFQTELLIGKKTLSLTLVDTSGDEDLDRTRRIMYAAADAVIICYSVVNQKSYLNVEDKWAPELSFHCPRKPVVLVGTKIDLRNDSETVEKLRCISRKPVNKISGEKLAEKIKAARYIECSAFTQEGLQDLFRETVLAIVEQPPPRRTQSARKICCCPC